MTKSIMSRLLLGALLWTPVAATASGDTPGSVTVRSYQAGYGPTHLLDTYLSQQKFKGMGVTFLSATEHYREGADASRWHTLIEHQASVSTLHDQADKREELQGDYTLLAGRLYGGCLTAGSRGRLSLHGGAAVAANVGFVYNTSNSNNPAQARLSLSLMPTVACTYATTLWKRSLDVSYKLNLPLAGVAFSPNYGQSYYEIFSLGNYDRNVVPTTLVSAPNFRQQLSVDYRLWRHTSLRVGYLGDYQQLQVNHLKSHIYHHRLMIGIVTRGVKTKK